MPHLIEYEEYDEYAQQARRDREGYCSSPSFVDDTTGFSVQITVAELMNYGKPVVGMA